MNQVLYAIVAVVLLGMALALARLLARRFAVPALVALIVTVGLVYDNGVIALGTVLGEGDALLALNWPRYWIHALCTPLLILFASEGAVRAGLDWARRPWVRGAFWLVTAALVVYGVVVELPTALVPDDTGGVLRYAPAGGSSAPIPAIATNLALIGVGVALWASRRWPWLAVAATLALVGFGLAPLGVPAVVGQVAELVLIGGILATEAWLQRREAGAARTREPARADATP